MQNPFPLDTKRYLEGNCIPSPHHFAATFESY